MTERREQAGRLADLYFDRALRAAEVRDLSRAEELLRASLAIRKSFAPAMDLLGLVCYEQGEIGEALRWWVESQNADPKGERAPRYLDDLRRDENRLRKMGNSLVQFNRALAHCKEGEDDIAAVELRRALTQNPKLVKGWQLLALLEINNGRFPQAAKMLRRVAGINAASPLTARLRKLAEREMKEAAENRARRSRRDEGGRRERDETDAPRRRFRLSPANANFLSLLLGLGIGLLSMILLFVPARLRRVESANSKKIVEYTNMIAEQGRQIDSLQSQLQESQDTVAAAREERALLEQESNSYVALLSAYRAYREGDYETAGDAIVNVEESLLADGAKEVYNSIVSDISENAFSLFSERGIAAFDGGDYTGSIPLLEKALALEAEDYTVLNRLAHAYRYTGDSENAYKYFKRIVDLFPDSHRAESVMPYLEEMRLAAGITEEEEAEETPVETEPVLQEAPVDENGNPQALEATPEDMIPAEEPAEEGENADGTTDGNTDGTNDGNTEGTWG